MSERIVTFFGTGNAKPGDDAYRLAYETGKILAQAGFAIANGGYGGTMTAAAKAAAEVGGESIGVTCSAYCAKANKYISREITTDSLQQRLATLIELGLGYVILPGGTGTLLELAMVWELQNKGFLDHGKPIILVGEFWMPVAKVIWAAQPRSKKYIKPVAQPEKVRELLMSIV